MFDVSFLTRRSALKAAVALPAWVESGKEAERIVFSGGHDAEGMIRASLKSCNSVVLGPGEIILKTTLIVPEGKRLIGRPGTRLVLSSDCGDDVEAVLELRSGSYIEGLEISGNLEKRNATGVLSRYVFGVVIRDASSCKVVQCRVVDCGSVPRFLHRYGGNGGGFLIEASGHGSTCVRDNQLLSCSSVGRNAGFHARIKTPFKRKPDGCSEVLAVQNVIWNLQAFEGDKNGIELVGPGTCFNSVIGCHLRNPRGQGGIEADLGASENIFSACVISFFDNFNLARHLDCFSQRTAEIGDGMLKLSHSNTFVDCSVVGHLALDGHYLRAFVCSGAGHGARFVKPRLQVEARKPGKVIGYYEDSSLAKIEGITVVGESFAGQTKSNLKVGRFD
ncbi:hypothetical protein ABVV53_15580 [Novosphingobium sp. RD2P27]|uniref:Right handed beta helix domain-containing protein n=1 Tax=Novosphingobium kalidii TaxID=3230299 RepID=A0ABV2D4R9_9SPHN